MRKTTIGILAGMGPRSTSPFLELLLDQSQEQYGAENDIDYPHIIIYSLPTPFFIDRETDEEALKISIRDGLERLQNNGVDIIGIPCNSAHIFFEYITENIEVPVLNIVQETVSEIDKGSKVSLFATEMTTKSELYQNGIKSKDCEYIFKTEWQSFINQIIIKIKKKDDFAGAKLLWDKLILQASEEGVEKIIIACTDLNVMLESNMGNIEYINSSNALARSLIKKYLEINTQ